MGAGAGSMFSLDGKVSVITGGTSGIGLAAAERFSRAGAIVVIAARGDNGAELAERLGATFVKTDVSHEAEVERLMDRTAALFGRIDVCINNAGVFAGPKRLEQTSSDDMREAFNVNTLGPLYGMRYAIGHMRPGGVIINTSSIGGVLGSPEYADYTAAKFSLNGLTRTAALEFGPLGIRVNCICPASVNTPMLIQAENGAAEALVCRTMSALDALIEPSEVAALMHFLAADDCPTLTGQAILLDAGITAGFSEAVSGAIVKVAASRRTERSEALASGQQPATQGGGAS